MLSLLLAFMASPTQLEIVSHQRIWNQAPHCAFGDLIRFDNRWYAVFREGKWHAPKPGQPDDGKLRVVTSLDGSKWESAALIAEEGTDLRDPHLSITAKGQLMIVAGGSMYPKGVYHTRRPRVMFSSDGMTWSKPKAVLEDGHWLWRVTWHNGKAYGVSKFGSPSEEKKDNPRRQAFVSSSNGVDWDVVKELQVPGGDETTVRFTPQGEAILLMRRVSEDGNLAMIGQSKPPYKEWTWSKTDYFIGGPNFIILPSGKMIAGGRRFPEKYGTNPVTMLGELTATAYKPSLQLPSGGDSSYPGFVWHDGMLWTLYYSSHEGSTAIYLAKIRVK